MKTYNIKIKATWLAIATYCSQLCTFKEILLQDKLFVVTDCFLWGNLFEVLDYNIFRFSVCFDNIISKPFQQQTPILCIQTPSSGY